MFALAMAAGLGDEATRRAALAALPRVCRTGTHLFQFATFVEGFRGWGRGAAPRGRRAGTRRRSAEALAYQAVKYRQREGVSHRDLLRLAHPARSRERRQPDARASRASTRALFEWIVRGGATDGLPRLVEGFALAQRRRRPVQSAALVREYGLPREAVQSEHLASARGVGGAARGHADDGARSATWRR